MYVEHIKKTSTTREKTLIHHGVGSHSLLGYTITSGRTQRNGGGGGGSGNEYVAISSPRSNGMFGSVLINSLQLFSPAIRLVGEGFESYFGYALATADLDGDGDDELLVGAPYFTPEFSSNEKVDK